MNATLTPSNLEKIEPITDVRRATFHYIFSHPFWYVSILLIVFLGFYLSAYFSDYIILVYSIVGIVVIYAIVFNKITGYFMRQFAEHLGYDYTATGDISSVSGSLFDIGNDRFISHVISGKKEDHPVRIFLYSYSIGSGKNKQNYRYTVFEKTFDCSVPHILVHRPDFIFSNDIPVFSGGVNITLEGDFNKYFSLAVEKDFEMEAYQLFTPDIMEELIETSKTFGFEFVHNKLYLYTPKYISIKAELDAMFDLSEKLCIKFEPVLHGMEKDVVLLRGLIDTNKK